MLSTENHRDPNTVWFTSDWHCYHKGILREGRERERFTSLEHMHHTLISNTNSVVERDHHLYFIGDLSFGNAHDTLELLMALNCRNLYLVRGNHDGKAFANHMVRQHFRWISELVKIKVTTKEKVQRLILCHYPMMIWPDSQYGAWHLHGHCHGHLKNPIRHRMMDVGVDTNAFKPYSYAEIEQRMSAVTDIDWLDHHTPKEQTVNEHAAVPASVASRPE